MFLSIKNDALALKCVFNTKSRTNFTFVSSERFLIDDLIMIKELKYRFLFQFPKQGGVSTQEEMVRIYLDCLYKLSETFRRNLKWSSLLFVRLFLSGKILKSFAIIKRFCWSIIISLFLSTLKASIICHIIQRYLNSSFACHCHQLRTCLIWWKLSISIYLKSFIFLFPKIFFYWFCCCFCYWNLIKNWRCQFRWRHWSWFDRWYRIFNP